MELKYSESRCMATNPSKPNVSGNSRGRVMHITNDKKKTICNLQVTSMIYEHEIYGKKECRICFKNHNPC
jgi:hypothetical protein